MSNFREGWGTKLGFILAATGSAIGLGNIWKFPYITGDYGGGAFVLVYLLCVVLVGLPLMIATFRAPELRMALSSSSSGVVSRGLTYTGLDSSIGGRVGSANWAEANKGTLIIDKQINSLLNTDPSSI